MADTEPDGPWSILDMPETHTPPLKNASLPAEQPAKG